MARVRFSLLVSIFVFLFNVNIYGSEITYNDLAVPTNYEVTSRDFRYVNLIVNNRDISFDELDSVYIADDFIYASYSEGFTTFDFKIQINRNEITNTVDSVYEHRLDVDDESPVLSTKKIICSSTGLNYENVDVILSSTSNQPGISEGEITCDTDFISSVSNVDVINVKNYSNYNFENNSIIYSEDVGFDLDNAKLSSLNNNQILDLANVDSNNGDVSISEVGEDYVIFTDGILNVRSDVYLDSAPVLDKKAFYIINYNSNDKLIDFLDISDDNGDDFEITYNERNQPGIYVESVEIVDQSYNKTNEEVLIIVNDGRYTISSDDKYIIDNSVKEVNIEDEQLQIEVYDINTQEYVSVDADIIYNDIVEKEQIEELENNYTEIESQSEEFNITFLYIIALLIILSLLWFL